MTICISKKHKIRLIFGTGLVTLLLFVLQMAKLPPLSELSKVEIQQSLADFPSQRIEFRKSNTSYPTLFEICQAINSHHKPHPFASTTLYHKSFPCDELSPPTITPHFSQRGNYWALYNFIRPRKHHHCDESITYTTHAEYTYLMDNLGPLLKRWNGPVSLAIYVPGSDFSEALRRLIYLRECAKEAILVQDFLSVHLFFDHEHLPESLSPDFEQMFFSTDSIPCSHPTFTNFTSMNSYRKDKGIMYPINVGRNIAKEMAVTKYVLPSDIELYPSPGLIPDFLDMIKSDPVRYEGRKLFVLPIFEADGKLSTDELPQNKEELVTMLKNKLAVPFHYQICPYCHKIPKAKEWTLAPMSKGLGVFHVANRMGAQSHWEPIYIGTKEEPGYDERLNWEGLKDKMSQAFILCVLEYELNILDNAFLIHSPGIKMKGPTKEAGRNKYVYRQSQVVHKQINPELKLLYGQRLGCVVQ